jgi:energy-coupling factor transporter ATP-binding protein EcfA2
MAVAATRRDKNALAEIVGWCGELPGWQQDAMRRIVECCDLTAEDIGELVALCKHGHGLKVEDVPVLRPIRPEHVPKGTAAGKAVTLCSIAEPENVNALDSTQELKFAATGLTVVFGYNGSGKSGYGRILRRACRARSSGTPILPNVLRSAASTPATAVITYAIDGKEQKPEQWVDGQRPVDALGSVSFFDTECAAVHVRDKHNIAFTPAGLDLLPKFGAACKDVQKKLDDERKKLELIRPKFLQSAQATGATAVGKLLNSLSDKTNIGALDRLASLNDGERQRLKDLAGLLANEPAKQAQEVRNRGRRIGALATRLRRALGLLSDDAITGLRGLAGEFQRKAQAAEVAAKVSFSKDPLIKVGDDVWRELWEAARRYSAVAYPDREFPVIEGDNVVCVLCQQPLADSAKDRLQRFEEFVADDTATQAAKAKRALHSATDAIDELSLRDQATSDQLQDIVVANAALHKQGRLALAALLRRRRAIQAAKSSGNWEMAKLAKLAGIDDICAQLDAVAMSQTTAAQEIERTANDEERKKLVAELAELQARDWLATVLGDVKDHLTRLAEIQKLKVCIDETKTNKVTAKSKALAKEYATDQLRGAFASEVKRMQQGIRRLNVELTAAAGEYGSSYYKIQLIGAHDTAVDSIVSEGEHQCIALAGFLAELATQQGRSAIVFDDPVNSLDHQWRGCFAHRLVEEAKDRQVVVFTHDIVFLHDLMSGADDTGVPISLCRVQSNRDHCGCVADGLPWVAQKTVQRIDHLEKDVRATQSDYDAGNDDKYEAGICGVYDGLRATVERAVEEWVFRAVIVRHRDYINLKDLRLVTAVKATHCERLQKLFQRCCDVMQAHDRSSLRSFGVPRPDEALADLVELRAVVEELRSLQKAIS